MQGDRGNLAREGSVIEAYFFVFHCVYMSVCSFAYLFICSFIHSFIHLFLYSLVLLLIQSFSSVGRGLQSPKMSVRRKAKKTPTKQHRKKKQTKNPTCTHTKRATRL